LHEPADSTSSEVRCDARFKFVFDAIREWMEPGRAACERPDRLSDLTPETPPFFALAGFLTG
jgi:hypothetical protein